MQPVQPRMPLLEDMLRPQPSVATAKPQVTALQIADKFQHIDGDQFYVSIERVRHPKLAGKPVVIRYKSIVSATSYEARALGIKAGMPYAQAVEIARQKRAGLAILPSDMERYVSVSNAIISIVKETNPETEIYSIDEVFCKWPQAGWGDAEEAGRTIMKRVRNELGITVSVGTSFSKYIAKLLTKHFKPDAMTTCHNFTEYAELFSQMTVDDLHGVGEKTAEKLATLSIFTIDDLAQREPWELMPMFKQKWSDFLVAAARGTAYWKFVPWYVQAIIPPRSVGNTAGIPARMRGSVEAAAEALIAATIMTCHRMQAHNYAGNTVAVGVRYSESGGMDRIMQQKLNSYTNSEERVVGNAVTLLANLHEQVNSEGGIINRVGIKVSGIRPTTNMPTQLALATQPQTQPAT